MSFLTPPFYQSRSETITADHTTPKAATLQVRKANVGVTDVVTDGSGNPQSIFLPWPPLDSNNQNPGDMDYTHVIRMLTQVNPADSIQVNSRSSFNSAATGSTEWGATTVEVQNNGILLLAPGDEMRYRWNNGRWRADVSGIPQAQYDNGVSLGTIFPRFGAEVFLAATPHNAKQSDSGTLFVQDNGSGHKTVNLPTCFFSSVWWMAFYFDGHTAGDQMTIKAPASTIMRGGAAASTVAGTWNTTVRGSGLLAISCPIALTQSTIFIIPVGTWTQT